MFRKAFTCWGLPALAAAAVLLAADANQAAARGGGGGGWGGAHVGGFRGGFSRGGYSRGYYGGYRGGYGGYRGYRGYRSSNGYGGYSYGYYPYYNAYPYSYGSYSYTDSYPYADSYPFYSSDLSPWAGWTYGPQNYGSYLSPTAWKTNGAQAGSIAQVTVKLPANAELWFDGKKMKTPGRVREFDTPGLTPGHQYTYKVKARWKQNGHTVTQTRQVALSAGAHVRVNFPDSSGTAAKVSTKNER
jgi:uncharacterized protein (TIGR03000 family)